MALRYLVSGGNGNSNSTTNWSASSGGPSGASVPGAADDIIIDAASLNAPLNFNALMQIRSITVADYTGTLTINSGIVVSVFGNGTAGFISFSSAFTFTSTGTGLLRFWDNNASTLAINTGSVILDCNVSFVQVTSGQPIIVTLQSNITVTKTLTLTSSNSTLTINGNFNINALGDVNLFSSSVGSNNANITYITGQLIMNGTTPQALTSNYTANSNFGIRFVFNSTSTITISGRYRLSAIAASNFIYISGTVICDSTQELRILQSVNMDSGPVVWNRLYFLGTTINLIITLFSDFYVKNLQSVYNTNATTSTIANTIQSDSATTRKFVVTSDGTQTNLLQLRSTAQIDSTDGQTIWSFNGTNAPARNWRLLLPPKGYGHGTIN